MRNAFDRRIVGLAQTLLDLGPKPGIELLHGAQLRL